MADRLKIAATLQTPIDAEGNRKDIHLVNTTDEVIVDPDIPNDARPLTQKLNEMRPVVQSSQPTNVNGFKSSFLWGKIVITSNMRDVVNKETMVHNLAYNYGSGMNTSVNE